VSITEARKMFPEETKDMSDKLLSEYCLCSDILSQLFLDQVTPKLTITVDKKEAHE
jgi:hypothetical protein